mmetsp:Transcript_19033/g.54845  ORF Transcript_19033/g.54845 Transcript_19033/m.54845 type:complete len:797 (-) Transcript_19033:160-2550(-)
MTTPRRRLRCGSALFFSSIVSSTFMASADAEQFSVAIPAFRMTLFPVTSDFDKKSARNVLSIAAETAQSYLYNQLVNAGVTVDEVAFDLRSWSFHADKLFQRNLRGGRQAAECTVCTDEPTENMARRGITCPKAYEAVGKRCREDPYWVEHRACEYSCWLEGRSYTDIKECCDPNAPPPEEEEDKREVMIKSEQPIGGYVVVTADSPSDLPDQLGVFSLITSSLFPGADEEADVGDRDDSVFVEALNEDLSFPISIKRGSFYAVDTPKEGVSGLVTESPTSSPPTSSTPTAKPSRSPVVFTSEPTLSPTESPVTSSPTRSPIRYTDEPTIEPTRRPTTPLRTDQPTLEGTLREDGGSEIDFAASEDMGDNEIDSTPAPSPNDYITKATDGGSSTNENGGNNTTLMTASVVTSLAILLLGAFFVHRRRRNQKEYDTAATSGEGGGGSSTTRTNINGDKSTQLRNLDALHAYDDGSLRGNAYGYDDEENKTLDTSRDTAPEDCNDIVADLVGGGADIAIHTGTMSKTNRPLLLNIPEGSVSIDDDNTTAPLSPFSQISPSALSPTSTFNISERMQRFKKVDDEPASPRNLKMIEPNIVVSSPMGLPATISAAAPAADSTVTEEKKMDEDSAPTTLPTKAPPLIPLTLDRVSSLGKEVEFDQPTFEPSEWDFNDNDADSMHSSDATSTNDPFITPDHMQLKDEDSLIPPFPPPCSSIGSPDSACTTNSRKTFYNHEYAYNDDESSSAASILFTVLGRKGGRTKHINIKDTDEAENRDSEVDDDDPDRFSIRDWNEIEFV